MKKLLILGGGFAGIHAALSGARLCRELNQENIIEITLISKVDYFTPRPRLYEQNLNFLQPIKPILSAVKVNFVVAEVYAIDPVNHEVKIRVVDKEQIYSYDILIFAMGSKIFRPDIPGINQYTFDVDNYVSAKKMRTHLSKQSQDLPVVVVGAGFTGLEVATEIASEAKFAVNLVDRGQTIGGGLGVYASKIIHRACEQLNINTYVNCSLKEVNQDGVYLTNGEFIASHTVIWAGGMVANQLTADLGGVYDKLGRVHVNNFLQNFANMKILVAGDSALVHTGDENSPYAMMSCQHGSIEGLFAGYNAVALLSGHKLKTYRQDPYITCLDLGGFGALLTKTWIRQSFSSEYDVESNAKRVKQNINLSLKFPIGTAEEILKEMIPIEVPQDYAEYIKLAQGS